MAPVLVSFSGIDGAGKSTQIEKLCDYLNRREIPVRILTFWDNVAAFRSMRSNFSRKVLQSDGQVGSPEKPANRNDKNTRAWPLSAGRAVLHLLDVFRLRRIVRQSRKTDENCVIIFDRYIYDQLAALPLDHWLARAYAKLVLRFAPQPDVCYLLDAVPEEARARKPEYPLDFMRMYRSSYLALLRLAPLGLISPADPDSVHAAVVGRLSQVFNQDIQAGVDSPVIA